MDGLLSILSSLAARFEPRSLIDITLVAVALYWVLTLISGTSAATLVRGILILLTLTLRAQQPAAT